MAVISINLKEMREQHDKRVPPRLGRRVVAIFVLLETLLLLALWLIFTGPANAQTVKGEVKVSTEGGFARLVFRLDEQVDANVRLSGAVMVISFKKPIDVAVDRVNAGAPDYISAARRDPDNTAIRFALARKVKINSIAAGERLFVDLLPEDWKGVVPGLPQEVINELSRRARDAERQLHLQRLANRNRLPPTVRVKVGTQPTFTRFIFDLPGATNVIPERWDNRITLNFDQPVNYDLADARAALPQSLESIASESEKESVAITFILNGTPDVRSFREDRSFVIDIGNTGGKPKESANEGETKQAAEAPVNPAPVVEPPETVPAKDDSQTSPPPPQQQAKVTPPSAPLDKSKPAPAAAPVKAPDEKSAGKSAHAPAEEKAAAKPAEQATPAAAPEKPEAKKSEQPAPAGASAKAEDKKEAAAPATSPPAPPPPTVAEKRDEKSAPAVVAPAPKAAAAAPDAKPAVHAAPKLSAEAKSVAKPEAKAAEKSADKPEQKTKPDSAAAPPIPPPNADAPVVVDLRQQSNGLRLEFPFAAPTPAAAFLRADTLWLVFDTASNIEVAALNSVTEANKVIRHASADTGKDNTAIVHIRLKRPKLASLKAEGPAWIVTIGDTVTEPTRPLGIARSIAGPSRASITVPFEQPRRLHRINDPQVGDTLMVISALGPARGFLKQQDFVELRALRSTHGVVLQPLADDINAELAVDKIVIGRPNGLALSSSTMSGQVAGSFSPLMFDTQVWGFDRQAEFNKRQAELIHRAAAAPESKRRTLRLDLARFYLARDMAAEAKAVIDVALSGDRGNGDDVTGTVLKAVANVLLDRPDEALKELANPQVGNQLDAPIWRAIAHTRQGKWAEARKNFENVEGAMGALPIELQRIAMLDALRSSIEVRDFDGATKLLNDFETIGVPPEIESSIAIMNGRLAEGLGRSMDALTSYRAAVASRDRRAAAQARLREILLRFSNGDMARKDVIHDLETLTTVWRGDETEVQGLKVLAHLYTEDGRFRDAFHVMRTALLAHPNSELTRLIQDEAVSTFDSLFLGGKGEGLPAIEALGLFYDYRELTPIGRRGDEMIRRLADRLVSVDLLDQAADLLQHQVDHRLQGAARAQVATRLAVIYLMNRRPDKALASLKATRVSELSNELREQRLLLEARALSDVGRHGLAAEIITGIAGREANRLRADILWAARQWREAAEQIELLYGERFREFTPLTAQERADILRAAIGFALGEDAIGLARFREKYAAKMTEGPDSRAFEVVSAPIGTSGAEFRDVAQTIAGTDTLSGFLRDINARYPDSAQVPAAGGDAAQPESKTQQAPAKAAPPAKPQAAAPAPSAPKQPDVAASPLPPNAPSGTPLKPDPRPTGSIPRLPAHRTSAR